VARDQFEVAGNLAKKIASAVLHGESCDAKKPGDGLHVLGPVALHHGHVLTFDRIGGRAWWHGRLADRAYRHFQKVSENVVAFPVMGEALKGFDELLSKDGRRRHA
jgi:hypothetical protein